MAYNTGGMLATTGLNVGQLIGGGFADLGAGIGTGVGGMMTRRRERQGAQNAQQQFQQIVDAYQTDPVGMIRQAQKAKLDPDKNIQQMGDMLMDEANRLTQARTAQTAALETAGQDVQREAQRKRAMQVATQDKDQNALVALRAGALDPVEYLSGRVTGGDVETVSISAGGALVDKRTGEVLYERPFKPQAAPAGKGIKMQERDDGSLTIVDADDGSLISTLPPPDTTDASQEASLNLIAHTTSFIKDVDALLDPGFFETGLIGQATAGLGGTPAYDREKDLLSIRARLGFDQINEMKRLAKESGASGTGLGQISNIEFMSLQSTIEAIYIGMTAEAQNNALRNIRKHLLNVQQLASGVAPADAIDWSAPEYKATGYHQDPESKTVFFAPDGPNGKRYKLVNGKFQLIGRVSATPLGNTQVK